MALYNSRNSIHSSIFNIGSIIFLLLFISSCGYENYSVNSNYGGKKDGGKTSGPLKSDGKGNPQIGSGPQQGGRGLVDYPTANEYSGQKSGEKTPPSGSSGRGKQTQRRETPDHEEDTGGAPSGLSPYPSSTDDGKDFLSYSIKLKNMKLSCSPELSEDLCRATGLLVLRERGGSSFQHCHATFVQPPHPESYPGFRSGRRYVVSNSHCIPYTMRKAGVDCSNDIRVFLPPSSGEVRVDEASSARCLRVVRVFSQTPEDFAIDSQRQGLGKILSSLSDRQKEERDGDLLADVVLLEVQLPSLAAGKEPKPLGVTGEAPKKGQNYEVIGGGHPIERYFGSTQIVFQKNPRCQNIQNSLAVLYTMREGSLRVGMRGCPLPVGDSGSPIITRQGGVPKVLGILSAGFTPLEQLDSTRIPPGSSLWKLQQWAVTGEMSQGTAFGCLNFPELGLASSATQQTCLNGGYLDMIRQVERARVQHGEWINKTLSGSSSSASSPQGLFRWGVGWSEEIGTPLGISEGFIASSVFKISDRSKGKDFSPLSLGRGNQFNTYVLYQGSPSITYFQEPQCLTKEFFRSGSTTGGGTQLQGELALIDYTDALDPSSLSPIVMSSPVQRTKFYLSFTLPPASSPSSAKSSLSVHWSWKHPLSGREVSTTLQLPPCE